MLNMALREMVKPKINKSTLPLVLILALSIFLRVLGTNPGYLLTHPDEPTITDSVRRISLGLNFEPQAYYYGSFLPLVYSVVDIIFLVPALLLIFISREFPWVVQLTPFGPSGAFHPDFQNKIAERWNGFLVTGKYFEYWTRYETAILSGLATLVVYLLGKKLFNRDVGLVAAFFTAVNYRHVLSSNFALADAPAAVFALLSVLLSVNLLRSASFHNYILAGVGLALALSVKYFIYVLPTFLLCHLLAIWGLPNKRGLTSYKTFLKKLLALVFNSKLVVSLVACVVLFFIINPYLFIKWDVAYSQLEYNTIKYGVKFSLLSFPVSKISLYPIYYLYKYGIGQVLSITIIIGFLYTFLRYPKQAFVLLSVVFPFLYFFLVLTASTHGRYFSPIIPFLLFFPAILISDFVTALKKFLARLKVITPVQHILVLTLIFILGFQSLKNSFLSSYYFSRPHNQDSLYNWILTELPDNSNYVYYWGVPIPSYKKVNETFLSPVENDYMALEELKKANAQYVAVGSDAGGVINGLLWINEDRIVKDIFFNNKLLWDTLDDSYASLVTRELGYYRTKEFAKPFWQALDPAYFIVKFPTFWNTNEEARLLSYDFEGATELNEWSMFPSPPRNFYELGLGRNQGYGNSSALVVKPVETPNCDLPITKITSQLLPVSAKKWYIFSSWGRRQPEERYKAQKNGFLRLDFYSAKGERLKTYVSKQLSDADNWEKLHAAGLAPEGSSNATLTIQFNHCNEEQYLLDHLTVSSSLNEVEITSEYPYFQKDLSRSFIWLPHL